MFKEVVTCTAFHNVYADQCFENTVIGDDWVGDSSFLSSLRALVGDKLNEDEHIRVYTTDRRLNEYDVERLGNVGVLSRYSPSTAQEEAILICNFSCSESTNDRILDIFEEGFCGANQGYELLYKVTEFFKKSLRILCFVNYERKSVCLYTAGLGTKTFHYIQCGIPAYFPWYFDPKDGLPPEKMAVIESLRQSNKEVYLEALRAAAEKYNFREKAVRKMLDGFASVADRREIESVKTSLEDIASKINRCQFEINQLLKSRHDFEIRYLGLANKLEEGRDDSDVVDFFVSNKNLMLLESNDSTVRFVTSGYVTYFDQEMAQKMIDNSSSYVYLYASNKLPAEDIKMLMKAIFIENKIKLKFCQVYTLTHNGGLIPEKGVDYMLLGFDDCMPNPHTDRYGCMGDYASIISQMISEGVDIIGIVQQCMASCVSLNFGDCTVMEEFMRRLAGRSQVNSKCIELPDGRIVAAKAAIEYLKEVTSHEQTDQVDG